MTSLHTSQTWRTWHTSTPLGGIPPICESVPVFFLSLWDTNPLTYTLPDPWFSGKWVNGSLLSEKGKAWSIRRHFLRKGAFMKQLAPIKVAFFFPNLNRYTQKKKLSHLLQQCLKNNAVKFPGKCWKMMVYWRLSWFALWSLSLVEKNSSQELKLPIYKHGSTYQNRRLISICRCVIIGGFVTWHVREMGSGVVVSHRISHVMSRARVAIFAALRSFKQTRMFWMMCFQWLQDFCAWQFLQTWPFWDGEFTWPFKGLVCDLQLGNQKVTNWTTWIWELSRIGSQSLWKRTITWCYFGILNVCLLLYMCNVHFSDSYDILSFLALLSLFMCMCVVI